MFIVVLLLLVFRSLLAPLVALIPAALALALASPVIAKLSSVGLPVSEFTDFILIVVVLGAGTDYGLFLVFRMREEMSRGLEPKEAVKRSVSSVGQSIVLSALTVMTAFASLLLASFGVYRGIGPDLAIAIGVVAIMDLTFLPALLALLGKAVFWPAIPAQGSRAEGLWGRIATRIVTRPLQTLIGGVVIFGVLSAFALGYSPAGFNGTDIVPAGSDSALGTAALAAHFPQAETNPTYIVFRFVAPVWLVPGVLVQAAQLIGQDQQFKAVAGPLDPNGTALSYEQLIYLHKQLGAANRLTLVPPDGTSVPIAQYEAYRATDEFISTDGTTVRFDTTLAAGRAGFRRRARCRACHPILCEPHRGQAWCRCVRSGGRRAYLLRRGAHIRPGSTETHPRRPCSDRPITGFATQKHCRTGVPGGERSAVVPRHARSCRTRVRCCRRRARSQLHTPGPRFHVPDGLRRGLQHSPHESREGRGQRSLADSGCRARALERPAQRSLLQVSSWQALSWC